MKSAKFLTLIAGVAVSTVVIVGCSNTESSKGEGKVNPSPPAATEPIPGGGGNIGSGDGNSGEALVFPPPPKVDNGNESDNVMEIQQQIADIAVGKPLAVVEQAAEMAGYTVRITKEDGEGFVATMDYRTGRLNVEVENGMVTAIYIG